MGKSLAVFLATSGHSGVDRIMKTLLPSIADRGIRVDLLHVTGHGPHIEEKQPHLRVIQLGSSHSFTGLFPLVGYLRREKPDAILSDKDRVNQVAIIAKHLAGVETKTAVRYGQTVSRRLENRPGWQKTVHYFSMKYLYRRADAIISPSEGAARDLSGFARIPIERITVIPNPIDIGRIRVLAGEPLDHPWFHSREGAVIVGLGELTSRKGFDTLIRALAILKRKKPARLFLMGKGRGREKLEKLSADLGLRDEVEFAGFKGNPFPFLARADLFVQPSRYEGFGMALLEALALGIPVVATDCPSGPREILQDGRFGRLVPVDDHQAMADAMEKSLDSPSDPEYLLTATNPYSTDLVTDRYLNLLGLGD